MNLERLMPGQFEDQEEIFALVSNYNSDPSWVPSLFDRFLVLDQSDKVADWHSRWESDPNFRRSRHVGHNLLDYFTWIVDNWDGLPNWLLLAKGNMIPRHITHADLLLVLERRVFSPCYTKAGIVNSKGAFVDSMGMYQEKNNNWYVSYKPHRYFISLDALGHFLFKNYVPSPYVAFSPGGLWLLPRTQILHTDVATYKALIEILNYGFFPAEAYMVERLMGGIFSGTWELRAEWQNSEALRERLLGMPDLKRKFVAKPGPLSPIKTRAAIFFGR
jgi:hypothetical protein